MGFCSREEFGLIRDVIDSSARWRELFSCCEGFPRVVQFWRKLLPTKHWRDSFKEISIADWIDWNMNQWWKVSLAEYEWRGFFKIACHWIWG